MLVTGFTFLRGNYNIDLLYELEVLPTLSIKSSEIGYLLAIAYHGKKSWKTSNIFISIKPYSCLSQSSVEAFYVILDISMRVILILVYCFNSSLYKGKQIYTLWNKEEILERCLLAFSSFKSLKLRHGSWDDH